jgi:hypothetical protein
MDAEFQASQPYYITLRQAVRHIYADRVAVNPCAVGAAQINKVQFALGRAQEGMSTRDAMLLRVCRLKNFDKSRHKLFPTEQNLVVKFHAALYLRVTGQIKTQLPRRMVSAFVGKGRVNDLTMRFKCLSEDFVAEFGCDFTDVVC